MGSPCDKMNFHQGQPVFLCKHPIFQSCLSDSFPHPANNIGLILFAVTEKEIFHQAFRFRRCSVNNRKILLSEIFLRNLPA